MRYKHSPLFALLLLPLVSGCYSGSGPLPVGTFVNQSDPTQVLQLTLDPSQTSNVLIRMSIETGANRYFGKSVGTYTLKTKSQSSKGTFAYLVISWGNSRHPEGVHEVSFAAENGNIWTLAFKADGSFVDSSGVAWKRQTQG
jgi:hypothetical protein